MEFKKLNEFVELFCRQTGKFLIYISFYAENFPGCDGLKNDLPFLNAMPEDELQDLWMHERGFFIFDTRQQAEAAFKQIPYKPASGLYAYLASPENGCEDQNT